MSNVITVNSNESTTPHISYIQYEGIVSGTIKQLDRVISKKVYHNKGGEELFKFLCKSLENSVDVKTCRPTKIKLFCNKSSDPAVVELDKLHARTSCITANEIKATYGVLPNETTSETEKVWYTTLHFTIPNILIHSEDDEGGEVGYINEVRLYPEGTDVDSVGASFEKYSADFKFTKNDGTEWDPIVINNQKHNYNLIITWTLSFTNKS